MSVMSRNIKAAAWLGVADGIAAWIILPALGVVFYLSFDVASEIPLVVYFMIFVIILSIHDWYRRKIRSLLGIRVSQIDPVLTYALRAVWFSDIAYRNSNDPEIRVLCETAQTVAVREMNDAWAWGYKDRKTVESEIDNIFDQLEERILTIGDAQLKIDKNCPRWMERREERRCDIKSLIEVMRESDIYGPPSRRGCKL